jgi:hypothetical protein
MSVRWSLVLGFVGLALLGGLPLSAEDGVGDLFVLGMSARGLGVGGAFTALVDDESAVLYNPAALGGMDRLAVGSMYAAQFGGVSYGAIGFAAPYVGVAVVLLDSGWIPMEVGGLRYSSQGVAVGVGLPIGPVAFGARWRLLRTSSPFAGHGWAIDPAVLVDVDFLRVGAVYEGAFSVPVRYEDGVESWPRDLRLGVAATLSPSADVLWSLAVEGARLLSASPQWLAGVEAWIGGLGARLGYDGQGPTFGLSVRFPSLEIDWAYATRADLGDSHRLSLSFRF